MSTIIQVLNAIEFKTQVPALAIKYYVESAESLHGMVPNNDTVVRVIANVVAKHFKFGLYDWPHQMITNVVVRYPIDQLKDPVFINQLITCIDEYLKQINAIANKELGMNAFPTADLPWTR